MGNWCKMEYISLKSHLKLLKLTRISCRYIDNLPLSCTRSVFVSVRTSVILFFLNILTNSHLSLCRFDASYFPLFFHKLIISNRRVSDIAQPLIIFSSAGRFNSVSENENLNYWTPLKPPVSKTRPDHYPTVHYKRKYFIIFLLFVKLFIVCIV